MSERLNDTALMALFFARKELRWEEDTKELCFQGLRYSTRVDSCGIPKLTAHLRSRMLMALAVEQRAREDSPFPVENPSSKSTPAREDALISPVENPSSKS